MREGKRCKERTRKKKIWKKTNRILEGKKMEKVTDEQKE
jgi:hypothetical protein